MRLTLLDYVFWVSSPVIMTLVVIVMYTKKLHSAYPYFFAYALLQVVSNPTLYLLNLRSYTAYFAAYYANETVCIVLSVAVFWDIFRNAVGLYEYVGQFAIRAFRYSILFIVGLIVFINVTAYPSTVGQWSRWLLSGLGVIRAMQCAIFLLLFFFRKYLGISGRNVIFGVALGFALYAAVNMLVAGEFLHLEYRRHVLREMDSAAYFVAALIWLVYVVRGSTQPDLHQNPRFPMFPRSRAFLNSIIGHSR